jgi:hypothetical protein
MGKIWKEKKETVRQSDQAYAIFKYTQALEMIAM